MRYKIRIKLTDFACLDGEQTVIDSIARIAEESRRSIFLDLWYREGDITLAQVKEFVTRHEDALETIGTHIHIGDHEHWTQRSWFNIRAAAEKNETEYRHEYIYASGSLEELLRGIENFRKIVLVSVNTGPMTEKHGSGYASINSGPPSHSRTETLGAVNEQRQRGYKVVIRRVASGIQK